MGGEDLTLPSGMGKGSNQADTSPKEEKGWEEYTGTDAGVGAGAPNATDVTDEYVLKRLKYFH